MVWLWLFTLGYSTSALIGNCYMLEAAILLILPYHESRFSALSFFCFIRCMHRDGQIHICTYLLTCSEDVTCLPFDNLRGCNWIMQRTKSLIVFNMYNLHLCPHFSIQTHLRLKRDKSRRIYSHPKLHIFNDLRKSLKYATQILIAPITFQK